ncbi:tetratricopeptide repeat protein [Sphingomonas quercus]|uniref:DUF1570 domain-containing protein n=1 Tax=Sphingomonas quercus TaxID=2842451 RepID=A0ABS6BLJ9_9SPHN|nr:hypothetical protein [Sphingomonas quercus]MBU3079173.1 hypothetical protein [Sphingomonas quercus]
MVAALSGAAPASAAWMEARSDHFLIYSDSSERAIREFATRLERFDKGMRYLHKLPDAPSDKANRLTVFVVSDTDVVRRLCLGAAEKRPGCQNVGGFYQPRATGSVAFTPEMAGRGGQFDMNAQLVLLHEYAHHFMMRNFNAAYPAWYIEGFAEFNSTASFQKDGSIGFGKPAMHRAVGLLRGLQMSMKEIMAADVLALPPGKRESVYGRGWLLTHYLTFSDERAGQLEAYLKAINSGKPNIEAATAAFGDLDRLDRDLDAYLRGARMKYVNLAPDVVPVGAIAVRALTAGEVAVMPVRMRSARGVTAAEAQDVVLDARKRAAPYPDDAGAQNVLAEAEYDAGNDTLAGQAVDRALAAAPEDQHALIYKGLISLRSAAMARKKDPAVWSEARGWFVKANRLEPDAAPPLLYYYQSYVAQGLAPTRNAVTGLERAFEVAPQAMELRILLARQSLNDGDAKTARALLLPLAFDPHGPAAGPATRLIAMIDAGQAVEASRLLGAVGGKPAESDAPR